MKILIETFFDKHTISAESWIYVTNCKEEKNTRNKFIQTTLIWRSVSSNVNCSRSTTSIERYLKEFLSMDHEL